MDRDRGIDHHHHHHHHQEEEEEEEIVEVSEDATAVGNNRNEEVYIAVGKNDLHVVKWALDHAVSPGTRVFLVHVFPPITYISTPVGRLSRSQLSQEQARAYVNEDRNKRKSVLDKYIRLCNDANVAVDTMLSESNTTAKTILDMIPVVNITYLVMGTKRSPFRSFRHLRRVKGKGEYVQKNAPGFCEVNLIHNGQKVASSGGGQLQQSDGQKFAAARQMSDQNPQRNFFECICFSRGKSNG